MGKNTSSLLKAALRKKRLVKFSRAFDEGSTVGYVLDVGPRWVLWAVLGDGIRFNGFSCLRLSDLRDLQVPAPYAEVAEAALKKRNERLPPKPRVSVATIEKLLVTANRSFPLITIHRERVDPDVCTIGRVAEVSAGRVWQLEIGPDAKWDREPTAYRISEITRVDFGGEYEAALHLVGGGASRATVRRDIRRAERLLPGKPLADARAADPRWQAIIEIGYSIDDQPEPIWEFALKWGKHPQEDLRMAIATVLLEHLLERHFNLLFPRVRDAAKQSVRFRDTLGRCWWMGEAAWPPNADALDRLVRRKLRRLRPKRPH